MIDTKEYLEDYKRLLKLESEKLENNWYEINFQKNRIDKIDKYLKEIQD